MAIPSPTVSHHRARVASLSRSRKPDDVELVAAKRDLRAEVLAENVRAVVAQAPPLTVEQRARIVDLLKTDRPQQHHADLGLLPSDASRVGGEV